ncbi:hypothetical protein BDW74DRAFT_167832 [Aspergillus multicolor]|uniref:ankyrin repeat domain-containing protein n=1 Tax=Aspergillus multicolor TaxID=41759 RepID=UPI003CCD90E5
MSYEEFRICTDEVFEPRKIFDADGRALYENESISLLRTIVTRNDTDLLNQYITAWEFPSRGIPVPELQSHDPFCIAVIHGSLDALRILLDARSRNPNSTSVSIEKERRFSLLQVACQHAQIEIVTFLLESEPSLATIYDRDAGGWTPLMAAAYSTGAVDSADRHRGEALMNMLLDRGASARDSVLSLTQSSSIDTASRGQQAEATVLSLAITGCSYVMVKRLLEAGADVHRPLAIYSDSPGFGVQDHGVDIRDVTALHLGSAARNVNGIRAALDHCNQHEEGSVLHLISCRDSMGRLPLHWAAAGSDPIFEPSLKDKLAQRITDTFELLMPIHDAALTAELLKTRDAQGATPLHYAAQTHAGCGTQGSRHAYHTIQWLISRGADASIVDSKGRTPLHALAHASLDGEPIDLDVIKLLIDAGCPLDAIDENDETALHILARHLRQAHAAKMLIQHSAKVDILNKSGNMPLHEAMKGCMRPKESWDRKRQESVSLKMRLQAQNEVVQALLGAHGTESVLDQANNEGMTPRVLKGKTRRWWDALEAFEQRRRARVR